LLLLPPDVARGSASPAAQEKDDEADRIGIWELRRLTEAENRESEASKVGETDSKINREPASLKCR
jgi:hypothetical protein